MIPLTQGQYTKVDEKNYEWLIEFNWCARYDSVMESYYAAHTVRGEGYKRVTEFMHQLITDFRWESVDHDNHDTLDNLESNLRDGKHNNRNRRPNPKGTSQYHGVYRTASGKWRAQIQVDRNKIFVGLFVHEVEAALAYDHASLQYHGKYGTRNFS